MQIVSGYFLLFFLATLVLYYITPGKARYIVLLAASLFFYASQDPVYLIFLGAAAAVSFVTAIITDRTEKIALKRTLLIISLLSVLGILGYFKYAGFFSGGRIKSLILPVGISFYSFQAVSYSIDVYRGTIKSEKNPLKYLLYVSFFPTVLSGPIERAGHLIPQFSAGNMKKIRFDLTVIRDGCLRMLWGYFLKIVLAERLCMIADRIWSSPGSFGGAMTCVGAIAYSLQIYCDFAGYTSIVIGASQALGLKITENFNSPYLSENIADFWRRWHISLSSWLKDYLYIPLGGNRRGVWRKRLNILMVFIISGLWHGAGFTFLIWGLLHGLYQVMGDILSPVRKKLLSLTGSGDGDFSIRAVRVIFTFILVSFAWIFFRSPTLADAALFLERFAHPGMSELVTGGIYNLGLDRPNVNLLILGLMVLFISDLANKKGIRLSEKISACKLWIRWPLYLTLIVVVVMCGIWGPGYNASGFIYNQF